MIFKKRLYFFSIGLVIGIFFVMFIFRGKNASFNYMPNARVIANIISKDSFNNLKYKVMNMYFYIAIQMVLILDKCMIFYMG